MLRFIGKTCCLWLLLAMAVSLPWEVASAAPANGTIVYLKARANKKFVCAESGGGQPLIANRDGAYGWEQFRYIDRGNGAFALQALANNKYVCAENAGGSPLIANRTGIGTWETFQYVSLGGYSMAFWSHANASYVCAENGGASALIANRSGIGTWETFTMIPVSTVHPINYMRNTSGRTLKDVHSGHGEIQYFVEQPESGRFWYVKNPWEHRIWEQYRNDGAWISLERDTSWAGPNGENSYDAAPWGSKLMAPTYNYTVGNAVDFTTHVRGFNFDACRYGSDTWWPGHREFTFRGSVNLGGNLGTVDVIILTITTQQTDPNMPKEAERHWYANGYGWVKWEWWNDFTCDAQFDDPFLSRPDKVREFNYWTNAAGFTNVCPDLPGWQYP